MTVFLRHMRNRIYPTKRFFNNLAKRLNLSNEEKYNELCKFVDDMRVCRCGDIDHHIKLYLEELKEELSSKK